MSTGLDCYFEERTPGEWYLFLEQSYGNKIDPEYDQYGPFATFKQAKDYLSANFANPGGYSVEVHPDSTDTTVEDWMRPNRTN